MPELSVNHILGKSSAILHSDGLKFYEYLKSEVNKEIVISFRDITHCTTAFLNASIGKYMIENKTIEGRLLRFKDTSEDIKAKIELVLDNAQNEKKRALIDDSAKGFLYA